MPMETANIFGNLIEMSEELEKIEKLEGEVSRLKKKTDEQTKEIVETKHWWDLNLRNGAAYYEGAWKAFSRLQSDIKVHSVILIALAFFLFLNFGFDAWIFFTQ